jgi:protease-4
MRRFFFGLFAAIGLLTVLAIVGIGGATWWAVSHKPDLPGTIVLRADLDRGLAEGPSQDGLANVVFGSGKPTLRDFLDALDRAGGDDRVKGIYAGLGADNLALATCQEVRDAIAAFRAKGKFAIAFATSFGEFGPGTRPYYLATAFDEIWLQPLGSVGLIGLHAEVPFIRGTLDKLGVQPSFAHREEYKTAMNFLTEAAMTAPQREETEALLSSDSQQIVRGIAAARKLPEAQVTALIDRGPFIADEAKAAGLVDRIGYLDEIGARVRQRAGAGVQFVAVNRYLEIAGRSHKSGPKIALIYGTGLIAEGDATSSPLGGDSGLNPQRMARAFREAARDRNIRAILFRIDSPGGSAVASETIWREVARARQLGKPVVVSMGAVAGSGGYYIAAPADKIVAEPATLTGSIGVLAGKLVVAGLLDKLGATAEAVQRGANAAMFSEFEDFSPAARDRLNAFLDATYRGFKQRVAAGRHLSDDQVEAIAKGRVWTGEEAKEKGLVDALGGYETALQLATQAAKIPAGEPFNVTVFPRRKSTLERLYDRMEGREEEGDSGSLGAAQRAAAALAPAFETIEALIAPTALHMPLIGDIR